MKIAMNQRHNWPEQRIELMCTHLEEYKKLTATALKVVRSMNDNYSREKMCLKPNEKPQLLIQQIERMTALVRSNGSKRTAMLVRQQKEMIEFDRRVEFEKNWYPGISHN
jgi:hypothetical protein